MDSTQSLDILFVVDQIHRTPLRWRRLSKPLVLPLIFGHPSSCSLDFLKNSTAMQTDVASATEHGDCEILGQVLTSGEAIGGSRRIHFIPLPVWSRSGSCPKSRFPESAQGRGLGRGLRFCPRMAKMAAEVCRIPRGANSPKLRTAC